MNDKVPGVLLVDDYEINLELLEVYLNQSKMSFDIYKAMTGQEALAIVQQHDIDLILLDVMLPDIDGFQICEQLKSMDAYKMIPIIMVTALHDKASVLKGLQAGADEFLTKPVDGHEVMIRVNNLLKLRMLSNDLNLRYLQLQKELSLATELQKSFLPNHLPDMAGIVFDVLYLPSSFIGGDFYDFLQIEPNVVGIFISDVKGHGVASAMITATLKDNLYKLKPFWHDPQQLFCQLNNQLWDFFANTTNDFFVTAFYGVLNLGKKQMIYTNAGHHAPYLGNDFGVVPLQTKEGLPLGIFRESRFENVEQNLNERDEIFMFTDGIFELNLFGKKPHSSSTLADFFPKDDILSKSHLSQLKEEIVQAVANQPLADDINYISIKINQLGGVICAKQQ